MFVGHYGVAFAVKTPRNKIPLWVLFVAVQLLDFLWAPFVLLGIEKVRFVPGITATNALDLYYMSYTHRLIGYFDEHSFAPPAGEFAIEDLFPLA